MRRRLGQLVAALKAPIGLQNVGFVQNCHNLLQIFFGDFLPGGNVFQGDETLLLVLCQI